MNVKEIDSLSHSLEVTEGNDLIVCSRLQHGDYGEFFY